jgi:hypothetical protein
MEQERLIQNLLDAGCTSEVAQKIMRFCGDGNLPDALKLMKKDRCRLMDELHETGRKVDCLDFLIRSTEKEMDQAKK